MDKISVATITYNNPEEFSETLRSVIKQRKNGAFIEIIVIDGSTQKDLYEPVYAEYGSEIDILRREPDGGIYYAMNKALDFATGDSIVFMNSGDYFDEAFDLKSVQEKNDLKNNVIYTCVKMVTKKYEIIRPDVNAKKKLSFSDYGHQGMYVPKSIYKEIKHDVKLFYSADHYWMKEIAMKNRNVYLPDVTACFSLGGVSNDYSWKNYKKYRKQPVKFKYKVNHFIKVVLCSVIGAERLNYLLFRRKYKIIKLKTSEKK